ncbi:MAG TPA: hypothetical protein VMF52_09180 [Steroidobacteraceae bacterium]|nr:hypothetical protein [Steroidobacteraceae bacterium]
MVFRQPLAASILVALLAAAPAAWADDPVKDVIDAEVPALKDGTKIALNDVQDAILAACKRRGFDATVAAPGLVTARWTHGKHTFDVTIPFSDTLYSIRYLDSAYMDYNPKKNRIDDAYNEYVAALSEHIEADFERALKRLKVAQKMAQKQARTAAN